MLDQFDGDAHGADVEHAVLVADAAAPWLGAAPPARGARGDTRPERQRRLDTLDRLRPGLSGEARRFWDSNAELVAAGVIHTGRFERYLAVFRLLKNASVAGQIGGFAVALVIWCGLLSLVCYLMGRSAG